MTGRSVSWVKKWRKRLARSVILMILFVVFSFAGPSCALLPLGYPRHLANCDDAFCSARELEAGAWPSCFAVLSFP
jgi:hypothetical protein